MVRKKVFAISGSTKSNSSNEHLLQFIATHYANEMEVEIFNRLDALPHFNPDNADNPAQSVQDFRDSISKADGVIICTPEYVFSLPGSLKNAIEWTVSTTVFSSKPVAMIVAAASGQKAFESLELIMKTIESIVDEDSKLLIGGIKGKIDSNGELDKGVIYQLDNLTKSLMKCIEKTDKTPSKYLEI